MLGYLLAHWLMFLGTGIALEIMPGPGIYRGFFVTQLMGRFCPVLGLGGLLLVSGTGVAASLSLDSPAFDQGQPIPGRYSCDGEGISPPLQISDVPSGAKSLVLIVDDPDAPGGTWVHWVLYNLSPDVTALAAGVPRTQLPGPAVEANNSYHKKHYGGVCPPHGDGVHHYHFKLYALDRRLAGGLNDKAAVVNRMQGHVMEKTVLTGTFIRP